ncbi:hypothetical protein JRG42_15110 [Pseudomonas granadensis]|uniref:hypothetical protein n=1 Tax=Pseudomonas granadensis TaxID=1421430 RepID=UPI0019D13355|nr:hypothetical protein [Pseudomonas granadensis]MBN6774939.1 hypothetical protein [Pseudomonas granadensis]MBN6806551.1 hypothetical protein [Pseudomonas granadensis]MBN6833045.1 hypothetical protein [Pseudomonas granadensis]MBN6840013.1 hypothetical protein [Pseudomonas granadensis]MBN6869388.1 hypothetical protein [Pseudomonas granadensis]
MSTTKVNSKEFNAHLYLNGRPVVLNQQRLQKALGQLRITKSEQLEAEVGLADTRVASFITLADHEDDEPLLLKFVPQGDNYEISLVHTGTFDNARLYIETLTHNLLASTSAAAQHFSISTYGVSKASLGDFEAGPTYLELSSKAVDSKSTSKPFYHHVSSGLDTFVDEDPNLTGHNAFNNKPATFVIKVVR